ncbi:Uncharacterized protein TCM_017883 [Theobroma cacao]|uniref:Uncharacterized protein n=1 Tax=Theobroma cacao TaxID=3641 RepID=A0A061EE27_THECC|nr:Uncharacterized protein TCM_017883 [Theobroma cacao]
MSRSDDSPDAPHSASEGSLDSTTRSQWHPDIGNQESGQSWIPPRLEIMFRSGESLKSSETLESKASAETWERVKNFFSVMSKEKFKEKVKEAMAIGSYRPRKVSAVRNFPPRCGRVAAPVSREECIRVQQAWIKDNMEKPQEMEEDPSICLDQGSNDPNNT